MSEGPIKRERAAHTSPTTSNTGKRAVHAFGGPGLAYCGRRAGISTLAWADVSCSDCLAAHRADTEGAQQ